MELLVNALYLKWGINGGTETYLSTVLQQWYARPNLPNSLKITLLCIQPPPWWGGEKPHFKIKPVPNAARLWFRILWEQLALPLYSLRFHKIYHAAYVGSIAAFRPQILFIPDAFAWHFPKDIGLAKAIYWRVFIPLSIWRARRVLCCSRSTADDLENILNVPSEKLNIVHLAGGHLTTVEPANVSTGSYKLTPKSFLLAVGFFKKIKNPYRILDAYSQYRDMVPDPMPLVLAGAIVGTDGEAIAAKAQTIQGTHIVGRISDPELKWLYSNAAGLVFVSLYEGFGIPILEAQGLGCPVITSTISSMPEVAGDGALLVDPFDIRGMAEAMKILHNPQICRELDRAGRTNESRFTWDRTADQILTQLIDHDQPTTTRPK